MAKKWKRFKRRNPEAALALMLVPVVAVIAGAGVYGYSVIPKHGEKQRAVCSVVVDRTASTSDAQTRALYEQAVDNIVGDCRALHASLQISFLDTRHHEQVTTGDGIHLWAPAKRKQSFRDEAIQAAQHRARTALTTALQVTAAGTGRSDVLGAVDDASSQLNAAARSADVKDKYLIVLSDGLERTGDIDVQSLAQRTSATALIRKAQALGLIPALEGTRVEFVGLRSGTVGNAIVSAPFEQAVESFWHGVVTAGQGRVCKNEQSYTSIQSAC